MSLLRYPADRRPVSLVFATFFLQLCVFFFVDQATFVMGCVLVLLIPQMSISAFNHHHSHSNSFRITWLNAPLNLVLALQTGIPTYGWVLHHNLGHHLNYLDQENDESHWARNDGTTMGLSEYILSNVLRMYPNMFCVGRRYPATRRRLVLQLCAVMATLGLFFYLNALNTVLVFVFPMLVKPALTFLATYSQHAGLWASDHLHASYNNLSPSYNWFFWNLGYHTAHHLKMAVHWSLLPDLHAKIETQIPEQLRLNGGTPWSFLDRRFFANGVPVVSGIVNIENVLDAEKTQLAP
ncbi:MAG: fatty acid desaturase [Spirochaetales bacterium]|nr:fatty acid desaturase [Spirochaetales bacterium]